MFPGKMKANNSELKEKIVKLKNPNSSVSSTRIILKHLDKTIT